MAGRMHIPRTPPPTDEGYGFHHIVNQNNTPYSSGGEGGPTDFSSSRGTPYGSPVPSWGMEHHQGHLIYDWPPGMNQFPPHSYPSAYPEQSPDRPHTRSHDAAGGSNTPSSRQATSSPASAKGRKAKAAKATKPTNISLDAPLSVLTKESKVPLKDMESFVHRSLEERTKEKDKKNGYIVRPMNAFMLYRSAYADRAKSLFAQNNHQIVSKATGQSWRLESKEIQDHYKMLAEIERDNHAKAWPDYKFTPSKSGAATRKRKESDHGSDDDDGSDQDPSDYDWTPSGTRKPRPIRTPSRRHTREKDLGSPYPQPKRAAYIPPPKPALNPSHYGASNPGRPMPIPMQELNSLGNAPHYYHQSMRYEPGYSGIQDIQYEHMPYGHGAMVTAPSFLPSGVPGADQEDFPVEYVPDQTYVYHGFLDPKLEEYAPAPSIGTFTSTAFDTYHGEMLAEEAQTQQTQQPRQTQEGPQNEQARHAEQDLQEEGDKPRSADPSITDFFNDETFQKWIEMENTQ